jgi:hypothetical protein
LRDVSPVAQLTWPCGACASAFVTQTLVGVLPGFGTASGAPNRQPALVQLRLLPVCADVVAPIVATSVMQLLMAGDRVTEVRHRERAAGRSCRRRPYRGRRS